MKIYVDCIPCFFRQALDAVRLVTDDERLQREVLNRVAKTIPNLPSDCTPVEMGKAIHKAVKEVTGFSDPYNEAKKSYNDLALSSYPKLKEQVEESYDRLLMAIRIAIAGNIIDFGASSDFDLERSVQESLEASFGVSDYRLFKQRLEEVEEVLYLGDNAGEIVFDRILVEELRLAGKKVIFAVREEPIINDATVEDALYTGLDEVAEVISSGSDAPGTILTDCNPQFIKIFNEAELIISKGQGNFEGLSGGGASQHFVGTSCQLYCAKHRAKHIEKPQDAPIFFLLKAKCPVIAKELGTELGALVLKGTLQRRRSVHKSAVDLPITRRTR